MKIGPDWYQSLFEYTPRASASQWSIVNDFFNYGLQLNGFQLVICIREIPYGYTIWVTPIVPKRKPIKSQIECAISRFGAKTLRVPSPPIGLHVEVAVLLVQGNIYVDCDVKADLVVAKGWLCTADI
ncbi:Hypothetical predicted protein [Prunus dulcis]|uniref:Uncharacterized protein n=1 Tax=Prunus dulcis TaxID=3755 RepID=A0A5E4F484_PRUDU|nr:hypothetical protein L3X38_012276 [Prunus dulcis]VVA20570.1 Hypothetical predicted protein [Prunus dulcis]VVA20608.1 Hypothetical predicted protein [Prunus dulcis]